MGLMTKQELDSDQSIFKAGCPSWQRQHSSSSHSHKKKSSMFHHGVTAFDRWLVRKMVDVVGNPSVRISLWDGVEVTPHCEHPVAIMIYCDRGALFKTILDPELHWGDLYCTGRVMFEGDMAAFMQTVYLGISGKEKTGLLRRAVLWLGHRRIFNSYDKAKENIHHHYDIGNDFYKLCH